MSPSALALMKTPGYTDPELTEILAKGAPVANLDASTDVHAMREMLIKKKQAMTETSTSSAPTVTESDHTIPTHDGASITVRVYQPKNYDASKGGPVMVMLHGGGWVLGGLDNEALLCRKWCEEFGGVTVNVDYRLAPEVKFPVPVYDCYDAVKWTAAHPDFHGGNLSKGFVVAGISAGANMACTITHLARDEALSPPLTGAYMSIPSLVAPEAVPEKWRSEHTSREENKDAPILNQGAIDLFRKHYQDDPRSPLMSPLIWPSGHGKLPATYLQVGGMDPLRDDALIYEQILREEYGVPTKMDMYPGLPHGFWSWWPTATFSKKHLADAVAGFRWLLEKH